MLLYNYKQEFLGINEEGLRLLNYSTFGDLLAVCSDVADLFAKEPGYIHNFKGFGWIDFLLHADSDASSAIIHANGRVFSCKLTVTPFYLLDTPDQNGYSIEMSQVKTISGEDIKPHTITAKATPQEYMPPPPVKIETSVPASLPDYADVTPMQLSEPSVLEVPDLSLSPFDDIEEKQQEFISPFKDFAPEPTVLKESLTIPEPAVAAKKPAQAIKGTRYSEEEQEYLSHHHVDKNYVYDPHVAANELGLPVDLIEEFIGDFIQQSYDFKDDLFASSSKNDINHLHNLSHKLKGVAANLRIEDALETLTVINTSKDPVEIEANLKFYFDVIQKLGGEAPLNIEPSSAEPVITESFKTDTQKVTRTESVAEAADDIYSFGLKQYDDEPLIVLDEEIGLTESHEPILSKETSFEKERLEVEEMESAEEPLLPETNDATDDVKEPSMPKLEYDAYTVAKSLGIDPEFMDELLFDYKNDSRIISNQITAAIKAFDTHACNESAARLKGISDNLRLNAISDELTILSKTHDAQEAKKASIRLNAYLDQL